MMEMVEEQEKEGRGMGGREEEPGMLDAACDRVRGRSSAPALRTGR